MFHSKIKQFWDYEKAQIKYGGTKEILKSCKASGIPVSERTVQRIASEMKAQELESDQIFEETGEVAGLEKAGTGEGWTPIIMTQQGVEIKIIRVLLILIPDYGMRSYYFET